MHKKLKIVTNTIGICSKNNFFEQIPMRYKCSFLPLISNWAKSLHLIYNIGLIIS